MFIGNVSVPSRLAFAPMAGVADSAFRTICREMGAGLTYTEMVSAKALCYQDSKTKTLLRLGEGEHPSGVQIFGSDPSCMGEAAGLAASLSGADFIDINMGCPVGKVVNSGDGCALMRDPEKAVRIIQAVVSGSSLPVTVKIRKGWDKGSVNAVEFALAAQEAGASAVTIHGRTRAQMYSGTADWDSIRDVKSALKVPVIANGDVFTAGDAVHILQYTGADMAMIGRGALGNPWIFAQASALLEGHEVPPLPKLAVRVDTTVRQFELASESKGERVACLEARRHFAWYLRGVPYSGFFKEKISALSSMDDIYKIASQIKRDLS